MKSLTGIRARDLPRLSEAAAHRRDGGRDLTLIAVAHDVMLRPQEMPNVRWSHLAFLPDGSAALTVPMPDGTWGSRPLTESTTRLLADLLDGHEAPDGQPFPLTTSQINRRISALCAAAGLDGVYGASSPRVGMAEDLADSGITVEALKDYGRWRGLEAAWGFVQRSRSYERLYAFHEGWR